MRSLLAWPGGVNHRCAPGPDTRVSWLLWWMMRGWAPQVGEFQCYDRRALASLAQAAADAGHPEWGCGGPHDAGVYTSNPEASLLTSLVSGHVAVVLACLPLHASSAPLGQ